MSPTLRLPILAILLLVGLGMPARAGAASDSAVASAVNALLASGDPLVVDGVTLNASQVWALYEGRSGSALWQGRVEAVTKILAAANDEGLDPATYHVAAIIARTHSESAEGMAALDLLVSDGLLRYAYDVRYGHSRPSHVTAEVALDPAPDPVPLVRSIAALPDPSPALEDLPPKHAAYRGLRAALASYRAAFADGKRWPTVPDGPTIRPGNNDAAVPALRARLIASGDLAPGPDHGSRHYDANLVAAMKRFQDCHGLAPDGVVGPRGRAALNVGIAERIQQIIVNMERWRWVPDELGNPRIVVNIAAARLRLIDEDGTPVMEMPVIVGETDKMTPMFSSAITHVIFNPTWTVPDKIARKELLPKVQRDKAYFERQGIHLIGGWQPRAAGDDPEKLDWSGARGAASFRLRQAPGPQNPLGRVKFLVPNVFGVYLHDTNSKRLFAKEQRTLSHGCVRVGDALGLADHLLDGAQGWSEARRERILSGWNTTTITLAHPIPAHLMYETAWVDADGRMHFVDDPYGRDHRLSEALAGHAVEPVSERVETAEP
ncbi:MAG TPA: L,D-transpeptidase family protein [Candidatus Eisenbacteria bacterium]|nr:L,D-transpeptidase family protein [Candidatus Eisenbacteria bacterium]